MATPAATRLDRCQPDPGDHHGRQADLPSALFVLDSDAAALEIFIDMSR